MSDVITYRCQGKLFQFVHVEDGELYKNEFHPDNTPKAVNGWFDKDGKQQLDKPEDFPIPLQQL